MLVLNRGKVEGESEIVLLKGFNHKVEEDEWREGEMQIFNQKAFSEENLDPKHLRQFETTELFKNTKKYQCRFISSCSTIKKYQCQFINSCSTINSYI